MKKSVPLLAVGLATLGLGAYVLTRSASSVSPKAAPKPSPLAKANADYAAHPDKAKADYESYVLRNAFSKSLEVQDHVGSARMHLGYLAAKNRDFPKARQTFLAAAETKGTDSMGEFGTVSDQAAYQAVVCLVAEGKKEEAIHGFETLLKERPLSPLSRAAYGRLSRLNGGESKPEWDRMFQEAIAKQEVRVRFETSVCGPKVLEKLTGTDYKTLAKLCGTKDSGTTLDGMTKGLKALGKESWAVRLNRTDLAKAKLPAILLEGDHYVLLEEVKNESAIVWDPRSNSKRSMSLPKLDDPDFSANLILLSKPEGL